MALDTSDGVNGDESFARRVSDMDGRLIES